MKILIVHNSYQSTYIGGEDIVVKREVNALKKILGEENVIEYEISNNNIQLVKLAYNIWGSKTHAEHIKCLIRQHNINLVHVHNFFPLLTPSVFQAAKEMKTKVVQTLHNFRWWCIAGTLYRDDIGHCEQCIQTSSQIPAIVHKCYRASRLQSLVGSLSFQWYKLRDYQSYIDAYFVLSNFQLNKLKEWKITTPLILKPNGSDLPLTYLNPKDKKDYLFVGRLEQSKGIEVLLKVWKKLSSNFKLKIIGKGEMIDIFKIRYQSANIEFLSQLPHVDVMNEINKAKYLIHPSLSYETFGLTMIEALSFGTPVIGFNIGTRPEFIQNEHNGFIGEFEELEKMIQHSFDHPHYERLSKNAFESVQHLDINTITQSQIKYYYALLEKELA